jgi:putative OPT family oligopeptide transporter
MGVFLGMVFGASSLYLVLKVGLTVSASIPVAVISVTLFRIFSKLGMRQATILENNIVQTAGSAGESIAFGVGVTMPAILILGFDLEVARVTLVALLGGLLGILMMIPLRRALIVRQHGILKYPEGTACAEVLKAGASEESLAASATGNSRKAVRVDESQGGARIIFAGFGIGLVYKFLMAALKCWKEIPEKIFGAPFRAGTISAEISPELLGVGYIIGPYLGAIMCGGGVLAYLVLIPLIKFFGEGLANPLAPGAKLIRDMAPDEIRSAYILYIGAGAVAAGGIISMMRSLPIIWHSIKEGLNLVDLGKSKTASVSRTELDLSPRFILVGIVVLVTAIVLSPPLHMNIMGALLIVVFGFLFATVSSRLTGEIGSSSNPISGMTVATLLLTCLIFLLLGWTQPNYYLTALSVGGIVCIASSNAGTTSQALKTGHLIGSTPRLQHYAILIGAFGSALILGPLLLKLNQAYTVYVPRVTFEKPVGQPATLPAAEVEKLPVFDAAEKPGPGYRLLTAAAGQPAAGLTNLSAGQYLVNAKGEVALKRLEHFGTAVRAPEKGLVKREKLIGPQAKSDPKEYWVWQKTDTVGGPVGRYLVNDQGQPVYLVDPGINGEFKTRPDGSTVTKLNAPKAVLMSYIIKGILDQKLPWTLMLLGVMIAIVLEMASIPSLAFAVGVYLPLSSSSPIFLGGMIRWLVDLYLKRKHRAANLTAEELQAEGDKSPGVLLASGYIAGGAIAGIFIALMLGVLSEMTNRIEDWSKANNPLFEGPYSDLLSLAPFIVLAVVLYLTGRDLLFRAKPKKPAA